jgi:hypothetical protein
VVVEVPELVFELGGVVFELGGLAFELGGVEVEGPADSPPDFPLTLDVAVVDFGSWPKPGFDVEEEDFGSCPRMKSAEELPDLVPWARLAADWAQPIIVSSERANRVRRYDQTIVIILAPHATQVYTL